MAKKKSYKWLSRLIDKITKSDQPNNDSFVYYGHLVSLQSGTRDFVDVYISDMDYRNQWHFSFDFWTKELDFFGYGDWDGRDAIIQAFRRIYNDRYDGVTVGYDEPWEEERKFYEPMVDDPEYDVADEWEELMKRKAA